MLEETVIPRLVERWPEKARLATKVLKVFGISEAEVQARLEGLMFPGATLAFGLDFPEIHVKLRRPHGEDAARSLRRWAKPRSGYGGGSANTSLGKITTPWTPRWRTVSTERVTLSLAESCTGGMMAQADYQCPRELGVFP